MVPRDALGYAGHLKNLYSACKMNEALAAIYWLKKASTSCIKSLHLNNIMLRKLLHARTNILKHTYFLIK